MRNFNYRRLIDYNNLGNKIPEPKFENDEKVYLDFDDGDIRGPYTIESSIFQPLTTVFMYRFKETTTCCGEMYLKRDIDDEKLSWSECMHDNDNLGFISEGISNNRITVDGAYMPSGNPGLLFFRPDNDLIKWLVKYANGRLIIDVGCGTGWLCQRIAYEKGKVMGIEPFFSDEDYMQFNIKRLEQKLDMIQIMPKTVQECGNIIKALCKDNRALILFARPCHSRFVEDTLDLMPKNSEALYITMPENFKKYDDLGKYHKKQNK